MMLSTPFHVYLNDHLALLVGERELCQRVRRSNDDAALGELLDRVREDCAAGEAVVRQLLKDRGAGTSLIKPTAAWLAEKAGRLKLNGRLVSYSPGSRVLELEGLILCAQARALLWRCLEVNPGLPGHDWAALAQRAEEQIARLRELHQEAARGLADV